MAYRYLALLALLSCGGADDDMAVREDVAMGPGIITGGPAYVAVPSYTPPPTGTSTEVLWFIGDSITRGPDYTDPADIDWGTFRQVAENRLIGDGWTITAVGTLDDSADIVSPPGEPLHDGHAGSAAASIKTSIATWAAALTDTPTVIVVTVGTVDVATTSDSAATISANAVTCATNASSAFPSAKIVVVGIQPRDDTASKETTRTDANGATYTACLANGWTYVGDAYTTADLVDAHHPTRKGAALLGRAVAEAIATAVNG